MKRYRKEKTPVKWRNTESNLNKKHASSTPMDRWMSVQYLRCKVGQCDGTSRVILQESNYTTRFQFQINLKISLSNCFFKCGKLLCLVTTVRSFKIEINKKGAVRRARIYYFRELTGKKANLFCCSEVKAHLPLIKKTDLGLRTLHLQPCQLFNCGAPH